MLITKTKTIHILSDGSLFFSNSSSLKNLKKLTFYHNDFKLHGKYIKNNQKYSKKKLVSKKYIQKIF